jgi:hypothetical protein
MNKAPIALFVYNRPLHTRQTVEALQKNELAAESDLFIFSDAPKNPEVSPAVQEVREYIRSIGGFKSISIVEREENLGLANSIIDGVTKICGEYGRIIVLEDDLVTSPYFLRFMNDALDLYEHEERVISIHGYMFPVKEKVPETFFLRGADCWGWATWKRGWDLFEPDGRELLRQLSMQGFEKEFNYDGAYNLSGMLRSQIQGEIDSWAIRWYASAFLKGKLTLYSGRSLVQNIGNDNSGTHCGATEMYSGYVIDQLVAVGGVQIVESLEARSAVTGFFAANAAANKTSLLRRVMQRVGNVGKRWLRWGG